MSARSVFQFSNLYFRQNRCFCSRFDSFSLPRSSRRISFIHNPPSVRRPPRHSVHTVHSSFGGATTVIVALAAGATCAVLIAFQFRQPTQEVEQKVESQSIEEAETLAMMNGETPPGRPGNLTSEQEAKLREFWTAVLQVFGVPELSNGSNSTADVTSTLKKIESKSRVETGSDRQKKKRKSGFFGRRHHDDDSGDEAAADAEDKYGQTKEYHKVLENRAPEELRTAFWSMVKHDDPDALLLRFLRARKWNVQNALVMLVATMNWRQQEMHVDDDIVRRGEGGSLDDSSSSDAAVKKEGHDFLTQMRIGKSFLHGTDKDGRPICFVRVKLHKAGEQTEASIERFTVYTIETARLLLTSKIDTAAILFDMTDFSMANMDYVPVRFMIKVFEANYPESLGVVLVHKAPWIFQGIWKIIKGWLDPVVAAKVHFTRSFDDLQQFIPRDHIIKELGGDDPWTYEYVEADPRKEDTLLTPAGDEARTRLLDARAATVKEYETLTRQWIAEPTQAGIKQKRDAVTDTLRTGYWDLDPYLRARTVYDRTGLIGPGGQIHFYPSLNSSKTAPAPASASASATSNGPPVQEHSADDVD